MNEITPPTAPSQHSQFFERFLETAGPSMPDIDTNFVQPAARAAHTPSTNELTVTSHGRYDVTTASGTVYLLDLDASTALRRPRAAPAEGSPASDLRKDGAPVRLINIVRCVVGENLTLSLGGVDDYPGYAGTTRLATRVISIVAAA